MNRIEKLFKNKKSNILSVFFTAGFPKITSTILIAQELEKSVVDMIEIGIPFSDPVADGPTIQQSNKIALENGMSLKHLLLQVAEIRKTVKTPVILMGYLNPVLQYGFEKFCKDASESGVDGLILPDLPMDEYLSQYKRIMDAHHLINTFLIAPGTTDDRIRKIDDVTNGFIYAVSSSSTTGVKTGFSNDQIDYFKKLQSLKLKNPYLIGFGISDHSAFSIASQFSAGAIVGSAFINMLKSSTAVSTDIEQFIRDVKGSG